MNKHHLRLILNGKSAPRSDVRQAVAAVRAMGHDISVRVTYEAGDTERLVHEALRDHATDKIDTVVSGGGDGTIHEVVDTVLAALPVGEKPPFSFAVLPLGTANDFAHHIKLDPTDLTSCLRFAVRAPAKPTDVGLLNGRIFVNMATGGFGTKVTAETDPNLKKILGGAAYLFTGLHRFSELAACEGKIKAEDFSWEGAFMALAVGNGRRAGGGIRLCPNAELDDGFLDLTIIPMPDRDNVSDLLTALFEGERDRVQDIAVMRRVRNVFIETSEPLQMNLDGEPFHGTEMTVKALPAKIQLIR